MSYLRDTANKRNIFKNLPPISTFSSTSSPELFEEKIKKTYNKENEEILKEVLNIIFEKLNAKDQEFSWTPNDYKEFKKEICKVDFKDINMLGDSIKKSLSTKNTNIYDQLKLFSTETTWYPKTKRIKDEPTNRYIYIEEEIKVSDCFYIINNITSHIKQYISRYLNTIKKDINEDFSVILEKVKNDFLEGYIKEYSYLTKYPLFIDIYTNGYNEILKRLEKVMLEYKSDLAYKQNEARYLKSDETVQRPVSLQKYHKDHYKKK